jgi:hypothetical protein
MPDTCSGWIMPPVANPDACEYVTVRADAAVRAVATHTSTMSAEATYKARAIFVYVPPSESDTTQSVAVDPCTEANTTTRSLAAGVKLPVV